MLPQYRREFYCGLREKLSAKGIELVLIYGKLTGENTHKQDEIDLDWAVHVPNKTFRFMGKELYWQPCPKVATKANLVIVEQANALLINYYLMLLRRTKGLKLAFWGHGRNMQDYPNSLTNRFKRLFIGQCDWWFAYTNGVKEYLQSHGYPTDRITVVQNSIDTRDLIDARQTTDPLILQGLRKELSLGTGPIGIYCGGMYREKRIEFLIDACLKVRTAIPTFELLVIGGGPDAELVQRAASKYPWIHYIGPKFGRDRVPYFLIANIVLMPGAVGLVILDSFALEIPLVTTKYPFHGPEIDYLQNNYNGLITSNNIDDYAIGIVNLLNDKALLYRLKENSRQDAVKYSVEKMVDNFCVGIQQALSGQ